MVTVESCTSCSGPGTLPLSLGPDDAVTGRLDPILLLGDDFIGEPTVDEVGSNIRSESIPELGRAVCS